MTPKIPHPPKINAAVIITCFNKEEYLDECVTSVLRQTRQPAEIVIIHDQCDNPLHHQEADTVFLSANRGVEKARDLGVKMTTAPLILFLDGDDFLAPDYLEKMALTIFAGADIAYPDTLIFSENERFLSITPTRINIPYVKNIGKVILPVTSLMKREVYDELGGFAKMEVLEDFDFFVRALKKGFKFKKSPTLLHYRRYPGTRNTLDYETRKKVAAEIVSQL